MKGVHVSSIGNEGIRALLNLSILSFARRFHTHKKHKKNKKHKNHKMETSDFPPLRCFLCTKRASKAQNVKHAIFFLLDIFMHIKMLSFLLHTKSTKSMQITKMQISEQATFLHLDVFYAHKNAVLFVFVYLYVFCAFCACETFLQKNK